MDIYDRQKGCFYGLAIGDALGAAVEFKSRGFFEKVTDYRAGGPHGLNSGEWTDDTSMAIALAHSLSEGWDPRDQLHKYSLWMNHGEYSVNGKCFDIGNTTRCAVRKWSHEQPSDWRVCGCSDSRDLGNGSIMRLAPVAIRYGLSSTPDSVYHKLLEESSSTTHAHPVCLEACVYLGMVLKDLFRGCSKLLALRQNKDLFGTLQMHRILCGDYESLFELDIDPSGYVINTLEAALWSFFRSNSFEEAVLLAVNLGDDSDTVGAVTGQLAGAFYGFSGIPDHLVEGLARKDMIDQAIEWVTK